MHTNGLSEEEEVVGEKSDNTIQTKVVDSQNFSDNIKESGVDMAFDALMDLEENADLATFMKSHMEDSDDVQQLWTLNSNKEVVTNPMTGHILR